MHKFRHELLKDLTLGIIGPEEISEKSQNWTYADCVHLLLKLQFKNKNLAIVQQKIAQNHLLNFP